MVRAILDGRKTQTRRVVTDTKHLFAGDVIVADHGEKRSLRHVTEWWTNGRRHWRCPYGQTGDRLWVRETFNPFFAGEQASSCLFLADAGTHRWRQAPSAEYAKREWSGWKPSIHMPRWASRLTLEITGVRVERVQDISGVDAIREGFEQKRPFGQYAPQIQTQEAARYRFRQTWDSLNAARGHGWDANPWVWVIEFRRVDGGAR